jgi:putative SOS response-associated peptidase YedK
MCGRFTITADPADITRAIPWLEVPGEINKSFNVAPTMPVPVVPNDGLNKLDYFIWGLIPSWAKDRKFGSRLINARGETVAQKPSFRNAYKRRRCLVIADGFYEWVKQPDRKYKIPHYIKLKSSQPFAFAGLWEIWHAPDGETLKSCTIITTTPNELINPLHDRMPVILPPSSYEQWLDPGEKHPDEISQFIKSYPASEMTQYKVSTVVNSPKNNTPECIVPLD